jgi:hypothetical protein
MTITPKLETNQPVFLLFQNKVWEAVVESIEIRVNIHDHIDINYWIQENPAGSKYNKRFSEYELHATKEELLSTL